MRKKSRKWLAYILSVVMLGSFLPVTTFAASNYTVSLSASAAEVSGEETVNETDSTLLVTEIRTEEDLLEFADSIRDGSDYSGVTVTLENDLSLTKPWTPVSVDFDHAFRGVFDGNQKTISGLTNSKDSQLQLFGLFIYLKNATVKDLTVKGTVDGGDLLTAAAGIAVNVQDSTLQNCQSMVDINSKTAMAAGLVHSAIRTVIEKSTNYGEISGYYAAGIANRIEFDGNTIRDCGNYGSVNGVTKSAGIVNEAGAYLSNEGINSVTG